MVRKKDRSLTEMDELKRARKKLLKPIKKKAPGIELLLKEERDLRIRKILK